MENLTTSTTYSRRIVRKKKEEQAVPVNNVSDIQIFHSEQFGDIRTVSIDGKPYFCGSDVAIALGYTNPKKAIIDHCKEDGVTFRSLIDSLGRKQNAKFISEGNLYRLSAQSHLPSAEKFESWVVERIFRLHLW